ncbi:MAG: tRNA (adenosine(37)-N6)-dimethylallyltransferase MiaA [Planctomycetes bacterium]|nr:tRNA (adenosine(37)-N6)-dimethylallyltransferase MiaA [Planctomycetota bacterium]
MHQVYGIMGCTASGKSSLAAALARRFGGEILSVDSMKIYRHMDIGTGKPAPAIRAEIPHHAIDVADPWSDSSFTVHDYVRLADAAISAATGSGKPLLAVGGTNLYLMGLLEGLFDGPGCSPTIRAELKVRVGSEGAPALHAELVAIDPEAARRIHPNDHRRIIRAMEVYKLTGKPISQLQTQWGHPTRRYECRLLLIRRRREDTNHRINARVNRMVDAGLVEEVRRLHADPRGLNSQASAALGYAEIIAALDGNCSMDDAVERIKINTRRFAKNQRTWFRRFTDAAQLELTPDVEAADAAEQAATLLGLTETPK